MSNYFKINAAFSRRMPSYIYKDNDTHLECPTTEEDTEEDTSQDESTPEEHIDDVILGLVSLLSEYLSLKKRNLEQ